jgi:hypothetical protein
MPQILIAARQVKGRKKKLNPNIIRTLSPLIGAIEARRMLTN